MPAPSLPARFLLVERDVARHDTRLVAVEERMDKAESRLDVLSTRVGIYAGIGAAAGGALMVAFLRIVLG